MRIALDAMGGDYAPGPIVEGAVQATCADPSLTVALVGDEKRILAELEKFPDAARDRLPLVHAAEVIGMDEKPVEALRRKRDNSISKSWGLMALGQAQAVVSAGSTGAMVASAFLNAKMFLPGVRRPAIAAVWPSRKGPVAILDVGANMAPKPEDLYQYGVMGTVYAKYALGIDEPTVGLLNVGSEDDKGNDLVREARALFLNSPLASCFVGNVEGRDLYEGIARVVVCEGFTGNVLLKSGEGAVEFLFGELRKEMAKYFAALPAEFAGRLGGGLEQLKSRYEYKEFGGGPLLGIRGACIICHGSSDARAIKNAIRVAAILGTETIGEEIVKGLAEAPAAG
jgi:glycerol-3-phosphate acyltransferase PlsX